MAYVLKNFKGDYEARFALSGPVGRLTKSSNTYYLITGPGGTPDPATNDPTYTFDTVVFQAEFMAKIDANQTAQFVTDELGNRYLKINQTETTV